MKRLLSIGVILFVVCWGGVSISGAEQLPASISKVLNVFFDSLERGISPCLPYRLPQKPIIAVMIPAGCTNTARPNMNWGRFCAAL